MSTITEKPTYEMLFREAEKYGEVDVFTTGGSESAPTCYNVTIKFTTSKHVISDARSDYGMSIEGALKMAIEEAIKILSSVPKIADYDFEYSRRLLENIK